MVHLDMHNKELVKLQEYEDRINRGFAKLSTKGMEIGKRIETEKRRMILDDGYFRDDTWMLEVGKGGLIFLNGGRYHAGFCRLRELIESDHHCSFYMEAGITIYFNDGDLHITLDTTFTDAAAFIKDNKLSVDYTNIEKRIAGLEKNLKAIKDILVLTRDG